MTNNMNNSIFEDKLNFDNIKKNYFCIKLKISESSLLFDLMDYNIFNRYYNCQHGTCVIPYTGKYIVENIELYILDQSNSGFIYIYFNTISDYNNLLSIIKKNKETKTKNIKNKVYRYSTQSGWVLTDNYLNKNLSDIFGYDNHINSILKDIDNHKKYKHFLNSIGETRSINYLLYGPSGTGKTSTIKAIASVRDLSVYIVNPLNLNFTTTNIKSIFSLNNNNKDETLKILLFEDFDRFLATESINNMMSNILNALDGFDDNGTIIRFFTANDKSKIDQFDALTNRISASFEYTYPDTNVLKLKLLKLLSYYKNDFNEEESNKINQIINIVYSKNISVRPFTSYIIRYMFDENYLDSLLLHIDELK